jgi:ribosomal protein S18 acetylase RimI-like enzyme
MPCDDWRHARPGELAPWYAAERERWLRDLDWDPAAVFAMAEESRVTGRLAGFVARDEHGRVTGVTYFSHDRGALQIGALHADRADVVRELLDHVLESPEASLARRYQGFLFPPIGGVDVALTRRRFDVMPQLYLGCPVTRLAMAAPATAHAVRPWRDADVPAAARLLARAYAGSPTGAAFAPDGRLEEWVGYLGAVLHSPACGAFEPSLTAVIAGPRADRLAGIVLTTRLSASTLHLAQVAVDPDLHRRGLAQAMIAQVAALAPSRGMRDVTLLVDRENERARGLYDRLGFEQRATFLLATRGRITRQPACTRPADTRAVVTR